MRELSTDKVFQNRRARHSLLIEEVLIWRNRALECGGKVLDEFAVSDAAVCRAIDSTTLMHVLGAGLISRNSRTEFPARLRLGISFDHDTIARCCLPDA